MNKKLFILPILFGALALFMTSCGDADPCKNVDCGANGTCFEGNCVCDQGYEGTNCGDEWSAKFVGSYSGMDVCTGENPGTYILQTPCVITRKDASTVTVANFGGFGSSINFTISKANASDATATVMSITGTDLGLRVFTGSATISGTTITGTYRVTYSDNTFDDCTFTYHQ